MNVLRSQRQRTLFLWLARLALFAYAFQLTAVDHWHKDMGNVVGDQGKSSHSYHCHGDMSGCADQGGISNTITEGELTPIAPTLLTAVAVTDPPAPRPAFIAGADEPPRFA